MISIKNVCEIIKKKGLKLTQQRLCIVEVLVEEGRHITAQQLYDKAIKKLHDINFSTIYRNLEILVYNDIVRKFSLSENAAYYELRDAIHHHHLICKKCGKVIELGYCPYNNIDNEMLKNTGFQAQEHVFDIYGYCKDCKIK